MIEFKNVTFSYPTTSVFENLNIGFSAGKIYGIMGKNGTGKSTLLSSIAGLVSPDNGSVKVNGQNPFNRNPGFLSDIFLVPEEFFVPDIALKDYVSRQSRFYPNFNKGQFYKYLTQFGIEGAGSLQQMSYGQKKKVLISFGLACNTGILLLDEPTNGLDIISKVQFKSILAGAFDEDKCFIISTHQVRDIENLVDQVCFIDSGKILFNESIISISTTLEFKLSHDRSDDAVFRDESILGEAVILRNLSGKESKVDLELLYKAISENTAAVCDAFNKLL